MGYRASHNDSARPAGSAGRGAGRISAGHDTVRLAGDFGDASGFPYYDDEDLEPVPVSAAARTGRRCIAAVVAAHDHSLAGGAYGARPSRVFGGRSQEQRAAYCAAGYLALDHART